MSLCGTTPKSRPTDWGKITNFVLVLPSVCPSVCPSDIPKMDLSFRSNQHLALALAVKSSISFEMQNVWKETLNSTLRF